MSVSPRLTYGRRAPKPHVIPRVDIEGVRLIHHEFSVSGCHPLKIISLATGAISPSSVVLDLKPSVESETRVKSLISTSSKRAERCARSLSRVLKVELKVE